MEQSLRNADFEENLDFLFFNKTYDYLYPYVLSKLSVWLRDYLKAFTKVGVGIADSALPIQIKERGLYIQFFIPKEPELWYTLFGYVRLNRNYLSIYRLDDTEGEQPSIGTLVYKFSKKEQRIFDAFIEGQYSKMYNLTDIQAVLTILRDMNPFYLDIMSILTQNKQDKHLYIEEVKEFFGVDLVPEDLENLSELALPPCLEDEILNYTPALTENGDRATNYFSARVEKIGKPVFFKHKGIYRDGLVTGYFHEPVGETCLVDEEGNYHIIPTKEVNFNLKDLYKQKQS